MFSPKSPFAFATDWIGLTFTSWEGGGFQTPEERSEWSGTTSPMLSTRQEEPRAKKQGGVVGEALDRESAWLHDLRWVTLTLNLVSLSITGDDGPCWCGRVKPKVWEHHTWFFEETAPCGLLFQPLLLLVLISALFVRQRRDGYFFPHDEEIGAEWGNVGGGL